MEGIEGIERSINEFYDKWEYYCYPDKSDKCRPEVDNFLSQIDKLQDQTSIYPITKAIQTRNKKPNCSSSKAKYLIYSLPTKNRLRNIWIRVYYQSKID